MANYTAADVKSLREQTGAGMLDCKNALVESDGDLAKAVEVLRVKGQKGVTKREGRTTSNGLVAAYVDTAVSPAIGVMVEVNCETDFVAKTDNFAAVARQVLDQAVASGSTDAEQVLGSTLASGQSVKDLIDEANAAIGEKVVVRRVARVEGPHVASYLHRTSPDLPPQIGVLVASDSGDEASAAVVKDIAMHVAAMSPVYLSRDDVPADLVESERRIAEETARNEGKPEQALSRIVEGRVTGFFKDNVLLEQAFAKESKKSVTAVLTEAGTSISSFARFRVGN